eukprot:141582-Ditylum_brightwellii.AAC.1
MELEAHIKELDSDKELEDPKASVIVEGVPRLQWDLIALKALTESPTLPLWLIRGSAIHETIYGFCDASGGRFGSTITIKSGVCYRLGTWGTHMDQSSSNYRELKNALDELELEGAAGRLADTPHTLHRNVYDCIGCIWAVQRQSCLRCDGGRRHEELHLIAQISITSFTHIN